MLIPQQNYDMWKTTLDNNGNNTGEHWVQDWTTLNATLDSFRDYIDSPLEGIITCVKQPSEQRAGQHRAQHWATMDTRLDSFRGYIDSPKE